MPSTAVRVYPVRSLVANCFVVRGERTILVDTGNPGNAPRVFRAMEGFGLDPREVSLILLTHGHVDHFGSIHEFKARCGAPVAIHTADAAALRAGGNPPIVPRSFTAHVLKPFFQNRRIAPCQPDIMLEDGMSLEPYGVPGTVVTTPGHTPGSVSVLLEGDALLAGDLLLGGYLGGHVAPERPGLPYFYDDLPQLLASVQRVLTLPWSQMWVGHGGPLAPEAIRCQFGQ
jgi:glyoxylase-like metal-dependent hydrolase (beta-lactamase superfamily II)